ncbi:MAG: type secretory pathway, ATPase PulE/Tfp pilus assembly pathway, ATPase PilB [Acidimicrobiales bacterium]|jgi:type IV pilus assembly protein PilB|nr:type secretory pathway, ATPase PulE/Tfp pilus assembly pathway, ATPase PilB [Acidimicrobiales bacterium]
MSDSNQLGALLVARGLLTREQLDAALLEHERTRMSLGRVLIEEGIVSEPDLVATLAAQIGLEYIDLEDYPTDAAAAGMIPSALARRYQALPIGWDGDRLVVAMADPSNVFAVDDIRTITGAEVRTVVATRSGIAEAIDRYHRLDADVESVSALAAGEFETEDDLSSVREVTEDAPIVKLVNLLITQAVQDRASDIHIEPGERDVRVRYRIDGVLHEVMRSAKNIQSGLTSRLKIMADLNIAERRVPQDGRITAMVQGKAVDLRVATLPTVFGEKVVMRILDKSTALLNLSDLGFLPDALDRFRSAYTKPYGTILVTGPTGSGKSTTLYATLNVLNEESKNIITVEDPVEYRLPGVNQVQVNVKAGLTFAAALRSILRSDPDIVLVGEIRDRETAVIAVESALTGHLVLSTVHTNDAASTATRLVEMGVEPFLVASALDAIVAQRLARKLCERCKEAYIPSASELGSAGWAGDDELPEIFRAVGCSSCGRTGYRGRFALHEVLLVSEDVERQIVDRAHTEDIKKLAIAQGMMTLRQTGMAQVRAGHTSIEEILRVVA